MENVQLVIVTEGQLHCEHMGGSGAGKNAEEGKRSRNFLNLQYHIMKNNNNKLKMKDPKNYIWKRNSTSSLKMEFKIGLFWCTLFKCMLTRVSNSSWKWIVSVDFIFLQNKLI